MLQDEADSPEAVSSQFITGSFQAEGHIAATLSRGFIHQLSDQNDDQLLAPSEPVLGAGLSIEHLM